MKNRTAVATSIKKEKGEGCQGEQMGKRTQESEERKSEFAISLFLQFL